MLHGCYNHTPRPPPSRHAPTPARPPRDRLQASPAVDPPPPWCPGAPRAPPLRVAPLPGDIIVGRPRLPAPIDAANMSTIAEAVWALCWDRPASSAPPGRLYVRAGHQRWAGPLVVPDGAALHVVGPTSAQLAGRWVLMPGRSSLSCRGPLSC